MWKCLFFLSICTATYSLEKLGAHEGIVYSLHWPENNQEFLSWSKIAAYKIASYLTDPVCMAREYSVRLQILQDLPPSPAFERSVESICSYIRQMQQIDESWLDQQKMARFAERCFLLGGFAFYSVLTPATALPAMLLRFVASNLENENFIHYRGLVPEKSFESGTLTHLHWNICGIKAGYEIEEGGQMPLHLGRIVEIAQKILFEDPDVICLNEVFDINDAIYFVEALKCRYAHFVIQCGSRTSGPNSGLFFATKFGVDKISFTPFPKEILVGNAKYSEKGFLIVKMEDRQGPIATMILSHLQHSNEPNFPTIEEEAARKRELDLILKQIDFTTDEHVILAGDLNLDDEEFLRIEPRYYSRFKKTRDYTSVFDEESKTWLGDQWYVEYGNRDFTCSFISASGIRKRQVSEGMNLDHVLVKIPKEESLRPEIHTILKSTGYNPQKLSRASLSDHMILFSTIKLKRSIL